MQVFFCHRNVFDGDGAHAADKLLKSIDPVPTHEIFAIVCGAVDLLSGFRLKRN
jgi:hypothetical protein